jgi:hypothetical protein
VIKSIRVRWTEHVARVHRWFWWVNLRERDHLEDIGVDGRIILKRDLKNGMGAVNWIALAQVGDSGRAVVNALMNFPICLYLYYPSEPSWPVIR